MKMEWIEEIFMNSRFRKYIWNKCEVPIIKSMINEIPKGSKCLEIGTGVGNGAISLVRAFLGIEIIATDFDPAQLEKAEKKIRKFKLEDKIVLKQADATNLPFPDNSFDFVLCYGTLHHIKEYHQAIKEVFRVLTQGGKFFVAEPPKTLFRWGIQCLFPPEVIFTKDEILNSLTNIGFKIDKVQDKIGIIGIDLLFCILAHKT